MRYGIKRSKWNPLRYILGEWTTTSNAKKAWKQIKFDASDIEIISQPQFNNDTIKTYLVKKQLEKWWAENPQMSDRLKEMYDKHYY
jgi:hypothetical protein